MELGKILTQLRKQNNQTQREFANTIGVSNGAVAMWETNKRQPDLETLKVIANHYKVSMDFLVGNESYSRVFPLNETPTLSSEEKDLLEYYNQLSKVNKRWIMGQIIDLLKKSDEDK